MTAPVLAVEDVTVAFGGLVAVDKLSMEVHDGELFGIIGPNGAGKTTLLNAVSGVIPISAGTVRLRAEVISGRRPDKIAGRGIARTFQGADFFSEFTVLESLLLGRWKFASHSMVATMFCLPSARRKERRDRKLALEKLDELGLGSQWNEPLSSVSYGTRKVLDVVRALLMEPAMLLLDEPTSGTTAADRVQLRALILSIKEQGIGVVLVDHDVKFISDISDVMLAMNFGAKLGSGAPADLLARPEVRAAYVGLE
jgi:branched-chain amino acid transport system ATP-binding protein